MIASVRPAAALLLALLAACGPGDRRGDEAPRPSASAVEPTDHPAATALQDLIRAIEREDPWVFLEGVSDDFRPNRQDLRNDLHARLLEVDDPRILAVVDGVAAGEGGVIEVSFHWDREWRLAATSDVERKAGRSVWTFERVGVGAAGARYLLLEARGDRLF